MRISDWSSDVCSSDLTTRAVRVRARIPDGDDVLKPGMFMTVSLTVGTIRNAVVVPEESLLAMGGEQFVYVIRDGRATRTRVQVGQRLDRKSTRLNSSH